VETASVFPASTKKKPVVLTGFFVFIAVTHNTAYKSTKSARAAQTPALKKTAFGSVFHL